MNQPKSSFVDSRGRQRRPRGGLSLDREKGEQVRIEFGGQQALLTVVDFNTRVAQLETEQNGKTTEWNLAIPDGIQLIVGGKKVEINTTGLRSRNKLGLQLIADRDVAFIRPDARQRVRKPRF